MKNTNHRISSTIAVLCVMVATVALAAPPAPQPFTWATVVNNADLIPPLNQRTFNSYNQPSVNAPGLVVFRARSMGGSGVGPATHGIYTRDMSVADAPIVRILDRTTLVPAPNNLESKFVETPSFPRIDLGSPAIATRGNHPPVWKSAEDLEPAGTTGIYTNPSGPLITGASKLGAVPGFDYFAVPGTNLSFDVFPGSPSVTGNNTIVFKGNYDTDPNTLVGKTGVFYRQVLAKGGMSPVQLIANSDMNIPGSSNVKFGSTAPPSAALGNAVFAGFDNEENPTLGGIYLAPLKPEPLLQTLVEIGSPVPGENNGRFSRIGEGLSFDGRYVGFWGAWGAETRTVQRHCPAEGNKARIAYCLEQCPEPGGCPTEVPKNQGIFVHDTKTGITRLIEKTNQDFKDFLFWNFSGKVPGVGGEEGGEDDGEPARWRSAAFVAISGTGNRVQTAFKALKNDDSVGIYLADGVSAYRTVLDTHTDGQNLDPEAPSGSKVVAVGVERDGFRNRRLVVNASMAADTASAEGESEGWAGIYLTRVPNP